MFTKMGLDFFSDADTYSGQRHLLAICEILGKKAPSPENVELNYVQHLNWGSRSISDAFPTSSYGQFLVWGLRAMITIKAIIVEIWVKVKKIQSSPGQLEVKSYTNSCSWCNTTCNMDKSILNFFIELIQSSIQSWTLWYFILLSSLLIFLVVGSK